MIKITQAPIFLEFLKRFIKDMKLEFDFDIEKELFIIGHCKCNQKDCATVYLKRAKPWTEEQEGVYDYFTNKGLLLFHINENGYFELEALEYEKFPYRQEVISLLYKKPKKNSRQKKNLSLENLASLDKYFKGLKNKIASFKLYM